MAEQPRLKPLVWLASAKRDLLALPHEVIDTFGYALHLAQIGKKHDQAKPLKGFGSAGVLEIAEDLRGNTYRAAYTVRFEQPSSCCTCFRRNPRGDATAKHDVALIRERLKAAERIAKELTK